PPSLISPTPLLPSGYRRRFPHVSVVLFTKQGAFPLRPALLACRPSTGMRENDMLQDTDASGALTQQSFITSVLFERTFDEGMALVEETARYLDGRGREEARALPRKASMLYAGESMRVTTRLMQAASWLLVQRAVRDGDMEADLAAEDRYRLGSKDICLGACAVSTEML